MSIFATMTPKKAIEPQHFAYIDLPRQPREMVASHEYICNTLNRCPEKLH